MTGEREALVEGFRLSPLQRRVWLLRGEKEAFPYRVVGSFLALGELPPAALRAALEEVVAAHEILRTTFRPLPGTTVPMQVIGDDRAFTFEEQPPKEGQDEAAVGATLRRGMWEEPLDPGQGPAVRVRFAGLTPTRHVVSVSLSALCGDGLTLVRLMEKVGLALEAARRGERPSFGEPMQYADLAEWQNGLLEGEDAVAGLEYWRRQDPLRESSGRLPLEAAGGDGAFLPGFLEVGSPDMGESLRSVAAGLEASAEEVLLACWLAYLGRLSEEPEVLVGVGLDGRGYEGLAEALGPLARTVPLRVVVEEGLRFPELVRRTHRALTDLGEWQEHFSWEELLRGRYPAAPPYLLTAFERFEVPVSFAGGDVRFEVQEIEPVTDRFRLKLAVLQTDGRMQVRLGYDGSRFAPEDADRHGRQFRALLESVLQAPQAAVEDLEILDGAERRRLLVEFNDTGSLAPSPGCVHELIEEQCRRNPEALAALHEERSLTYGELLRWAEPLSRQLRSRGVGPDVMVGICVDRSLEMLVGILGVLKAGGAYVPLDPAYPAERRGFILEDTKAPVILTQRRLAEQLSGHPARVLVIDAEDDAPGGPGPAETPAGSAAGGSATGPDHVAYVIHTSGSTGNPKGVPVTHRNLMHSTHARFEYYPEPVGRYLLLSSFAFDSSVAGLFWTLAQGGTLVLPGEGMERDPAALVHLIAQHRVTHTLGLPSLHALLLDEARNGQLDSLRVVIVAGEACPRELVRRHHEALPQAALYNEYGPTEATVWSSVHRCRQDGRDGSVPIGRPIPGARLYVLDRRRRPVPVEVPGELHIGGPGVTPGYLNQPDLTREKFVPDPFSDKEGERLYRSGDLARYLPNGEIEFLGRVDHQVKIRGYRIELEELESVLRQHPAVRDAVLMARDEDEGASPAAGEGVRVRAGGAKRLVAYLTPAQATPPVPADLRSFLRAKLPEYMVPSAFVILGSLPLMPNGKVDRRALPPPDQTRPQLLETYVAPRNAVEQVLAGIFSGVLALERVGVHDNFFDLGGHSILATQLASRLRDALPVAVPLRLIFESPTVAGLAEAMLRDLTERPRIERAAEVLLEVSEMSEDELEEGSGVAVPGGSAGP